MPLTTGSKLAREAHQVQMKKLSLDWRDQSE
jgi:hypothetical protein